jgi:pimeloyl-ACP methyl ester carboxylesterase
MAGALGRRGTGQTVGMPDLPVRHFRGRDGTQLAYREVGHGRPVVLVHGYFSNATVNWVNYGHAAAVAARGFRVIMPDLRGHGDSAKPQQAADYPPDILADDGFALIEHLGLTSYALGGYSLGGRTTIRMLARGAAPSRAVVAGMGLDGVLHASGRNDHFRRILTQLGTFERRSAEGKAEAFLKSTGADPVAMLQLLDSAVDTPPEALAMIGMPVLVVAGTEDDDNGSAEALAAALPRGQAVRVPGNHMSAVARPELGVAIADFLNERAEEDAR